MGKFFKESKNRIWGPFSVLFAQICPEMNFPGNKGSVSFEVFQLSTIMQKIQKKLMSHSQEKCQTDR